VFSELRHRGVNGVKWVVSDGHEGIQAAVSKQFPGASWQRCWTHFIRGALAKVSHKDKDALAKDLCGARKFEDVKICLAEAELVARRWEKRYPKVAAQIRAQFEETLAVHALPPEQRRRVYTTNLLERIMREIKRRIRVVGIFPNVPSCDRLVGAQLIEIHEKWQCERARYITFEQETTTATKRSAKRKAA
jgi:putative transposase